MSRAWLALALTLAACGAPAGGVTTQVAETPLQSDASAGRSWRRMNLDQLRASIERVSGGIGWTEEQQGVAVQLFESLDGTLGKPDYLSATEEELAPGLLFQKFLDDAATSVCAALVAAEPGRAAWERTLLIDVTLSDTPDSNPAAIEANLRGALLRFHGREVPAGDASVQPWKDLLAAVYANHGDMAPAWQAVCTTLIVHPDFYRY
jgi:hypothetical protein